MRYWYWGIGALIGAVVIILLLTVWGLSRSLLFYWHLLPPDNYEIVVGVKEGEYLPSQLPLERVKADILTSQAQATISKAPGFLYARSASRELVMQPTSIQNGLVQIHSLKDSRIFSVKEVAWAGVVTVGDILMRRYYEGNPILLLSAAPNTFYANSQPLSFVAGKAKNELSFSYVNSLTLPGADAQMSMNKENDEGLNGDLFVSIPSALLHKLAPTIKAQIETNLLAGIGLTSSKVDILESLRQSEAFAIDIRENDSSSFSLAMRGTNGAAVLESWLAAEYGKHHPVTQPFLLPDGTRGFEVVPVADTTELFTPTSQANCRSAGVNSHSLFLCTDGNWSVVSRTETAGSELLKKVSILDQKSVAIMIPTDSYKEGGGGIRVVGTTEAGTGVIQK